MFVSRCDQCLIERPASADLIKIQGINLAKSGLVLYAVNGVEIPLTKFTMSWDKDLDIQEIDLSTLPNGTYFLKLPDATEGIKLVKGN